MTKSKNAPASVAQTHSQSAKDYYTPEVIKTILTAFPDILKQNAVFSAISMNGKFYSVFETCVLISSFEKFDQMTEESSIKGKRSKKVKSEQPAKKSVIVSYDDFIANITKGFTSNK